MSEPMTVTWHDIECGAYAADLALWEELASDCRGPLLELGCGSGRVALHLARRGHRVFGLDSNEALLDAFSQRAGGLPATAVRADARDFDLPHEFALVLAPMQLLQLLGGAPGRSACLRCVAAHLADGSRAAVAIVDRLPSSEGDGGAPLPDAREIDGWLYSSLPLEADVRAEAIVVRRLRQTVSPQGRLNDELDEVRLSVLDPQTLEQEAEEAGLRPAGRREIPATDAHVGSTVVLLEAQS